MFCQKRSHVSGITISTSLTSLPWNLILILEKITNKNFFRRNEESESGYPNRAVKGFSFIYFFLFFLFFCCFKTATSKRYFYTINTFLLLRLKLFEKCSAWWAVSTIFVSFLGGGSWGNPDSLVRFRGIFWRGWKSEFSPTMAGPPPKCSSSSHK